MSYLPEANSSLQTALSSRTRSTVVLEACIDTMIALLALIGNILVLLIIYRKPTLRTIPNYFVLALAVSDIAMAVCVKPLTITTLIRGSWIFNYELCQFQGFITVFLASFSLNTLTLMAINRYCRIIHPMTHRKFFNPRKTKIYLFIAVFLGVFAGIPYFLAGYSYEFHAGKYFCYQRVVLWSVLYLMVIFLGTPTIVIIICYLKVFLAIRQHKKSVNKTMQRTPIKRITVEEIKITNTLFATVVAFLLCWMPVLIIELITLAQNGSRLRREVYVMFTVCASASSAVNPIIYGIMNRKFRKEYINLLRLCGIKVCPERAEVKTVRVNTIFTNEPQ